MAERESAVEGGIRASWSLLRLNRDFRRLYLASVISLGGDWFLLVPLWALVLELTGSPIYVALSFAAMDVPFFLVSPFAGALVDRLDRRKLMVACDVVRAVLCLGFLLIRDESTVWIAFPLLAVLTTFSAVFDPASSAALPNLVDDRDLATGNALSGSLWGTMLAIGSAMGGLVAAAVGRDAAFLIDGASFAASAVLIFRISRSLSEERHEEHAGVIEATAETVRYARKDHRVLALLAVKFGFGLGAGGLLVLLPVFASDVFHGGDGTLGLLMSARGVGALVGPFIGRRMLGPRDRRLFAVIGLALATFGLGYAFLGLAPSIAVAMLLITIAHLGGGAQWTTSSYGLQRIVPDRIRGRIFAFDNALITLTFTISGLVSGFVADRAGPRPTAVALGLVALVFAGAWTRATTDVRRATLIEGCGEPEPEAA